MSDDEDDISSNALVEEMLQQGDTAVIYPEAPEDEAPRQGTPDTSVHDENGTEQTHRSYFAENPNQYDSVQRTYIAFSTLTPKLCCIRNFTITGVKRNSWVNCALSIPIGCVP